MKFTLPEAELFMQKDEEEWYDYQIQDFNKDLPKMCLTINDSVVASYDIYTLLNRYNEV